MTASKWNGAKCSWAKNIAGNFSWGTFDYEAETHLCQIQFLQLLWACAPRVNHSFAVSTPNIARFAVIPIPQVQDVVLREISCFIPDNHAISALGSKQSQGKVSVAV